VVEVYNNFVMQSNQSGDDEELMTLTDPHSAGEAVLVIAKDHLGRTIIQNGQRSAFPTDAHQFIGQEMLGLSPSLFARQPLTQRQRYGFRLAFASSGDQLPEQRVHIGLIDGYSHVSLLLCCYDCTDNAPLVKPMSFKPPNRRRWSRRA
jgi:hypothetical protein